MKRSINLTVHLSQFISVHMCLVGDSYIKIGRLSACHFLFQFLPPTFVGVHTARGDTPSAARPRRPRSWPRANGVCHPFAVVIYCGRRQKRRHQPAHGCGDRTGHGRQSMPGVGPRSDERRDLIGPARRPPTSSPGPAHGWSRACSRRRRSRRRHRRLEGLSTGPMTACAIGQSDDVFRAARCSAGATATGGRTVIIRPRRRCRRTNGRDLDR